MDIRKDFESAATFIHRLAGLGEEFSQYNNQKWPHLKNREDFDKIYRFPDKERIQLEELYAKGRDCAIFMGSRLRDFNNIGQFPSLADYVDSFDLTWVNERDDLEEFIEKIQTLTESLENVPWAVRRMIDVFEDQLRLLTAVRKTLDFLKQTTLYKVEKGDAPVEKESGITIGHINGKVNINSTDNSTNITIDSSPIFGGLSSAISNAPIEEKQKTQLLAKVEELKQAEGTDGFVQKYKEFMQNAANHMTVVAPFIPALTTLLG
ncbi:MAG: hypothetical protein K2Y10_09140 [Burkholderiaceae bacterium]|nr:hypothetical protein [Burkholderiaceae bacterium]